MNKCALYICKKEDNPKQQFNRKTWTDYIFLSILVCHMVIAFATNMNIVSFVVVNINLVG